MLRRRKFFQGRRIRGKDVLDITWLDASGIEMADNTWNSPGVRCLGVRLNGDAINESDERGERIVGATLVMLLNAGDEADPVPAAANGRGGALGDAPRYGRPVGTAPRVARTRVLSAPVALDGRPQARGPQA